MSSKCGNIAHRTIEGVLTYLNAFLILDLSRNMFQNSPGLAVMTIIVITIVLYFFIARRCVEEDDRVMIPPQRETMQSLTARQRVIRRYR